MNVVLFTDRMSTGYCCNLMYFYILHKCFLITKLYFDIHCVLSNWLIFKSFKVLETAAWNT